jgi:hypothetical protein
MNPISMMMAASRACNKKEDLVPSKPVPLKRKVGRPPTAKLPEPAIVPFPVVDLTSLTSSTLSRRNYVVGDAKTRWTMPCKSLLNREENIQDEQR